MDDIKRLIYDGRLDEAIHLLDTHIAKYPADDDAWRLRGNAYRRKADFRQALNSYLKAIALNPDSPAVQAHALLTQILDYNNNDVYNP
ncbi:MAG: tetratricopeptide repeat protein [Tannerellaceae bacterium]|jgi:cytochrome c-type biogenesis protein CcmH/NrfG|nr:tetratricopeptide repeat protein [Tannerellaceae bacterium]